MAYWQLVEMQRRRVRAATRPATLLPDASSADLEHLASLDTHTMFAGAQQRDSPRGGRTLPHTQQTDPDQSNKINAAGTKEDDPDGDASSSSGYSDDDDDLSGSSSSSSSSSSDSDETGPSRASGSSSAAISGSRGRVIGRRGVREALRSFLLQAYEENLTRRLNRQLSELEELRQLLPERLRQLHPEDPRRSELLAGESREVRQLWEDATTAWFGTKGAQRQWEDASQAAGKLILRWLRWTRNKQLEEVVGHAALKILPSMPLKMSIVPDDSRRRVVRCVFRAIVQHAWELMSAPQVDPKSVKRKVTRFTGQCFLVLQFQESLGLIVRELLMKQPPLRATSTSSSNPSGGGAATRQPLPEPVATLELTLSDQFSPSCLELCSLVRQRRIAEERILQAAYKSWMESHEEELLQVKARRQAEVARKGKTGRRAASEVVAVAEREARESIPDPHLQPFRGFPHTCGGWDGELHRQWKREGILREPARGAYQMWKDLEERARPIVAKLFSGAWQTCKAMEDEMAQHNPLREQQQQRHRQRQQEWRESTATAAGNDDEEEEDEDINPTAILHSGDPDAMPGPLKQLATELLYVSASWGVRPARQLPRQGGSALMPTYDTVELRHLILSKAPILCLDSRCVAVMLRLLGLMGNDDGYVMWRPLRIPKTDDVGDDDGNSSDSVVLMWHMLHNQPSLHQFEAQQQQRVLQSAAHGSTELEWLLLNRLISDRVVVVDCEAGQPPEGQDRERGGGASGGRRRESASSSEKDEDEDGGGSIPADDPRLKSQELELMKAVVAAANVTEEMARKHGWDIACHVHRVGPSHAADAASPALGAGQSGSTAAPDPSDGAVATLRITLAKVMPLDWVGQEEPFPESSQPYPGGMHASAPSPAGASGYQP